MFASEIMDRFRGMGYRPEGLTLKEVIRTIQVLEHNTPCFGRRPTLNCIQRYCCWKPQCSKVVPDWEYTVCAKAITAPNEYPIGVGRSMTCLVGVDISTAIPIGAVSVNG
jgi:hypothetical protein